jgi:hypothetical protein
LRDTPSDSESPTVFAVSLKRCRVDVLAAAEERGFFRYREVASVAPRDPHSDVDLRGSFTRAFHPLEERAPRTV